MRRSITVLELLSYLPWQQGLWVEAWWSGAWWVVGSGQVLQNKQTHEDVTACNYNKTTLVCHMTLSETRGETAQSAHVWPKRVQ